MKSIIFIPSNYFRSYIVALLLLLALIPLIQYSVKSYLDCEWKFHFLISWYKCFRCIQWLWPSRLFLCTFLYCRIFSHIWLLSVSLVKDWNVTCSHCILLFPDMQKISTELKLCANSEINIFPLNCLSGHWQFSCDVHSMMNFPCYTQDAKVPGVSIILPMALHWHLANPMPVFCLL